MNTGTKVTLGILGAAAAGVIIGLLIAPDKGTEMRKKIRRTAGEWADNLSHLFSEGEAAAEDAATEVKDKGRRAKAAAEEKISSLKDSLT
jgi:gas vesicle protein